MSALPIEDTPTTTTGPRQKSGLDPRAVERVVVINHVGRSGSVFLHSLLDGHSRVLTFPNIVMCGFYGFWNDFGHLKPLELIAKFVTTYDLLFALDKKMSLPGIPWEIGLPRLGKAREEVATIDRDVFVDLLLEKAALVIKDFDNDRLPRKFFFQAAHVAYAEALGRDLTCTHPTIVFHAHCPPPSSLLPLVEDFPDAKFLHCTREPVQSLGSWFKSLLPTWNSPDLTSYVLRNLYEHSKPVLLQRLDGYAIPGMEAVADVCIANSRSVRLEDIHNSPRETLGRIAVWLDLGWENVLLVSTLGGKILGWHVGGKYLVGNAFQKHTISKKHRDVFWALDRFRLRFHFADRYAKWGYDQPPGFHSPILRRLSLLLWVIPFKMEILAWRQFGSRINSSPGLRDRWRHYVEMRRHILGDRLKDWDRNDIIIPAL